MKNLTIRIAAILTLSLTFVFAPPGVRAAELSAKDKQFLSAYENIRAALAADDLDGAKKAAGDLGNNGAALTKTTSLEDARSAFEKLSEHARHLAGGQSGYYVAHCPMVKKDWVQTSTTISNPYGGKDMVTCGEIKK